jgi:hypothetical protein
VSADVVRALNQTSDDSTLSEEDQCRVLAQACTEACHVLRDWLGETEAEWSGGLIPLGDELVKSALPKRADFEELMVAFLDPAFGDARRRGMEIGPDHVRAAIKAVQTTARRTPRLTRAQLFRQAWQRVDELRRQVCDVAGALREDRGLLRKARKLLGRVRGLLPEILVSVIITTTPAASLEAVEAWAHTSMHVVAAVAVAVHAQAGVWLGPGPGVG